MSKHSDPPVLSVNDLAVQFDSDAGLFDRLFSEPETVRAVDGVTFEIPENEVIALIGESGCGKTTLGKTAIGLQKPTDGTIYYRGQDIWDAENRDNAEKIPQEEIRRSLQIIHQDPGSALNSNQQVKAILETPLKKWYPELNFQDRYARIYNMLERVGMAPAEDYAARYPHQLSGGEKQRVALVRALLMNPDVILADEAVSALDVSLRVEMMDLMLELQDQFNTSFIFISHDLSNARYLADKSGGRIGIMYLGRLVEIGTVDQIINNPKHPYTKALRWATPSLSREDEGELPVRTIDIPDPVDPPSGCRYHTRCPDARDVCTKQEPELRSQSGEQSVACFRDRDGHEYWDSDPLES